MKEVYEFIKKCEPYYIATVDAERPKIRPFGTIDFFEGKIYFFTDKTKNVSKQIKNNPKIEICGMADGKWIRLEATAVEDDRAEARQHMLDALPFLKEQYSACDNVGQVFYLMNATATISAFTNIIDVIMF